MSKKQSKKIESKEILRVDALIPSEIFYNKNLSDGAKVFYGVIMNLSNQYGHAFASTYKLSQAIGRSTRSIQYYISDLEEMKLAKVWINKGIRYIKPLIYPDNNNDQFVIPSEVVSSSVSSTVKLSYGLIQYKSTNKNDHFGFTHIEDVAKLIDKSVSTAYRHLKAFMRLNLAKVEKSDNQTRVITINSYKTKVFNNLTKRQLQANLAPPEYKEDPTKATHNQVSKITLNKATQKLLDSVLEFREKRQAMDR
jgi:hypothetical protein